LEVSNNLYVKPLRDALVAIGALEDKLPPVEDYNPFDDEAPDFAALRQMDLSNGLISSNLGVL
jgi:hypothetical protein